jgi:DNA-binding transcriptional ArsR family regulator
MATDQLTETFAALADPTRRAIIERLTHGEATVNELAEPFDISLQAVSKHIKVLERAGLIRRRAHQQQRRCRIRDGALDDAMQWIERYRQEWSDRFDRLDAHLQRIQKGTQNDPAEHSHD